MIRNALAEVLRTFRSRRLPFAIAAANIAVIFVVIFALLAAAREGNVYLAGFRAAARIDALLAPGADPMSVSAEALRIQGISRAEYLSEKETFEYFRATRLPGLSVEIEDALGGVPLPALLRIHPDDDAADLDGLAIAIKELPGVDDVIYGKVASRRIASAARYFKRISSAAAIIAGLLGMLLSVNSVRSAFLPRRDELRILAQWGATDRFIVMPACLEGGIIGVAGAIAGAVLLVFLCWWLSGDLAWIAANRTVVTQLAGMLLLSFATGAAGGVVSAYEAILDRD